MVNIDLGNKCIILLLLGIIVLHIGVKADLMILGLIGLFLMFGGLLMTLLFIIIRVIRDIKKKHKRTGAN